MKSRRTPKRRVRVGRPKGADVEATRARIVAAAAKEFAAHGYAGARTVRIAERAGLTHAMLHYHFDTKRALYDRVLATLAKPFRELLGTAIRATLPPADLARSAFRLFARNRDYIRIVLWELAGGGENVDSLGLPSVEALESGLRDQLAATVGPERARQAIATLLGATLFYFFDDPNIILLFGRDRFDEASIDTRAEHLAWLAQVLFQAECTEPGRDSKARENVATALDRRGQKVP
jgi:AcrR family transcriptional regulator